MEFRITVTIDAKDGRSYPPRTATEAVVAGDRVSDMQRKHPRISFRRLEFTREYP